jgi:glutamate-1-semialdehyde 2,1-aminomutase
MTILLLIFSSLLLLTLPMGVRRWMLSRAKHPSLAGHVRWAARMAAWVPFYEYAEADFFSADGAPRAAVERRRHGFNALSARYKRMFPNSAASTRDMESAVSDLQFTARYRVPFQFSEYVRRHFPSNVFYDESHGTMLRDLDGNLMIDLSGSYGVNTFGYDFYKACIAEGSQLVAALGPVLGSYHPAVGYNVERLRAISGLDEVSFHMSGTEAVMQAVRLARYHSRRRFLVRFCGAYHGWWGDVQPGVGNPSRARDTFTLAEMSAATLRVLSWRDDIACVLVNPLQAMHPNTGAPSDSTLVDSSRHAAVDRQAYGRWLAQLRDVCSRKGIALIFDEVFVGFRLAQGGAQEFFGVEADLVTYGKTVAGGLPIGVLCGRSRWMRRYRMDSPADVCFARGTFNTHPYVMGTMNAFLRRLNTPEIQALYQQLDETWDSRASMLNARLSAADLPIRVVNFSSIWTVIYLRPSRYNWMLQFYLRAEGIGLSWVGTGRLIFSLNFTQKEFEAVADRLFRAASAMHADGWWAATGLTNRSIRRRVLGEMLQARRFRLTGSFSHSRTR